MYPCARGCKSTCLWLFIHIHVALYPRAEFGNAHGRSAKFLKCNSPQWRSLLCIWATEHNGVMRYAPWCRISLSVLATAQNHFIRAQNHKACCILYRNNENNSTCIDCTTQGLYYLLSKLEMPPCLEQSDSVLGATVQNEIFFNFDISAN
jgi:hypothetical protein